jgi:hypothetical protein
METSRKSKDVPRATYFTVAKTPILSTQTSCRNITVQKSKSPNFGAKHFLTQTSPKFKPESIKTTRQSPVAQINKQKLETQNPKKLHKAFTLGLSNIN